VCLNADLLARAENLEDRDYIHLRLASVFLFFGYVFDYHNPHAASRKRAEEILTVYGFDKSTFEAVASLMSRAFSPEQDSAAGRVLHDAVYDFTGRVDFVNMTDRLFREEMAYGKVVDLKEWFRELISNVQGNPFLTDTARRLESVSRETQLNALQSFADERINNN
jgi:hypothetical protein